MIWEYPYFRKPPCGGFLQWEISKPRAFSIDILSSESSDLDDWGDILILGSRHMGPWVHSFTRFFKDTAD